MSEELAEFLLKLINFLVLNAITMVIVLMLSWPYTLVHESGHYLVVRLLGGKVEKLTLWFDGGLLKGYVKINNARNYISQQWMLILSGGVIAGFILPLLFFLFSPRFAEEYMKFVVIMTLFNLMPSRDLKGFSSDGNGLFWLFFRWIPSVTVFIIVRLGLLIFITVVGFRYFGIWAGFLFLGVCWDEFVKTAKYLFVVVYLKSNNDDRLVDFKNSYYSLLLNSEIYRLPFWYFFVYISDCPTCMAVRLSLDRFCFTS